MVDFVAANALAVPAAITTALAAASRFENVMVSPLCRGFDGVRGEVGPGFSAEADHETEEAAWKTAVDAAP
jgi:hypothetical protein